MVLAWISQAGAWPSNSLPATKARLIICAARYHVITRTLKGNKQIAICAPLAERRYYGFVNVLRLLSAAFMKDPVFTGGTGRENLCQITLHGSVNHVVSKFSNRIPSNDEYEYGNRYRNTNSVVPINQENI